MQEMGEVWKHSHRVEQIGSALAALKRLQKQDEMPVRTHYLKDYPVVFSIYSEKHKVPVCKTITFTAENSVYVFELILNLLLMRSEQILASKLGDNQ